MFCEISISWKSAKLDVLAFELLGGVSSLTAFLYGSESNILEIHPFPVLVFSIRCSKEYFSMLSCSLFSSVFSVRSRHSWFLSVF